MSVVPEAQAAGWWRQLADHDGHGRCRDWAEAFAALVAHDLYLQGPPPDIDRPHETTGAARRTA